MSCPTAPVFMSFLCLICRHYSAFFICIPLQHHRGFFKCPVLFNTTSSSGFQLSSAAPFYLHTLLNHTNTARAGRSEPRAAAVTQHVNSSPSKGCLFPKTLRLGNSSNNITKHIMLMEPAEKLLQTEPQVLHTQDSGTGQGNT